MPLAFRADTGVSRRPLVVSSPRESDRPATTQVPGQVCPCRRLGSLPGYEVSFGTPNAPSQPDAKNKKACEDDGAYRDRPTKGVAGQDVVDAEEQRGSGHHAAEDQVTGTQGSHALRLVPSQHEAPVTFSDWFDRTISTALKRFAK
jgi:hypothetical protein